MFFDHISAKNKRFLHYNLRKSIFFYHISAENIAHFKKKYYLCTQNPKNTQIFGVSLHKLQYF